MQEKSFLVKAEDCTSSSDILHSSHNSISCSVTDRLLQNLPITVAFFYRESIDSYILVAAFRKVLKDFPIFAGTLKKTSDDLYIDCNNQGVLFSVATDEYSIDSVLERLPTIGIQRLVDPIDPKNVVLNQSPILTVKLTYFACGGMIVGLSWHHSIGDMHTFMQLMKAWSNTVNKEKYPLPLITFNRDRYLEDNLIDNKNTMSGVRYLNIKELLKLSIYMLFKAKDKIVVQIYFSKEELSNIKKYFSHQTDEKLSKCDALCAYLFGIILELDKNKKSRYLSIAIDYRSRVGLPQNLSGNFVASINVIADRQIDSVRLAERLRISINNFQQLHMDVFSSAKFINENGGIKKIDRFVMKGIDPINRNLFVTNWSNFGVYDVIFEDSKPFYFTALGNAPFPWLSIINEGFSKKGLIYSVTLPSDLAKILMQGNILKRIHKYRNPEEVIPELIKKLDWLS